MNLQSKWMPGTKKREILTGLALTIILFSTICMFNIPTIQASKTLAVPKDYSTINEAINNASSGDTVSVQKGIYYENLQVNKSISIVGEDAKSTIIIGVGGVDRGANAVITVVADDVKVSGFTLESLNYSKSSYYATGIKIIADHCTIEGNIIQNCYFGIFCSIQSYTQIIENTVTGSIKDGIRFCGGSLNVISDNNIVGNAVSGIAVAGYSNTILRNKLENNLRGIGLGSTYSVLSGNTMDSNTESGIFLAGSQNTISANTISNNKWGIYISPQMAASHENRLYHNNFLSNIFNAYDNSSSVAENWDNGYQSGGNYWSDYQSKYPNASETDNSGIWNTPFLIWSGNFDNYPLMNLYNITDLKDTPSATLLATANPNSVVASWPFDTVDSNNVTPDATGQNPGVLGSTVGNTSFIPQLVAGKFGKALSFNGNAYINVRDAPSLETAAELTIDAWINVQSFKNVSYNNIIVECVRTTDALPIRTLGVAINGEEPQNASSPLIGALRAYVFTKNEGLNEIVTIEPVVSLNQWIHVVFTRSLTSGMHLYVDGQEQQVNVTAGVANPSGAIMRQNEIYIGHDAICTIDELQVSNMVEPWGQPLWMQWWLWSTIIFAGVAGSGLMLYFKKQGRVPKSKKINFGLREV